MTMKIRLIKECDNHEPVFLGIVSPCNHLLSEPVVRKIIGEAWLEFQDTKPNCDFDFPAWLIENHSFVMVSNDEIDIML